jgi:ATP-binding cassette subfamily B protein
MTEAGYSFLTLYRRLLLQARPYWAHLLGVFLISLLAVPLALLTPLPLKIAVDSVIGSQPVPGVLSALLPDAAARSDDAVLLLAAGLLVAIMVLTRLQAGARVLLQSYAGEKLVLEFRARLFRHVQRLSLSYLDTRGTGDSMFRIEVDARSIESATIDGIVPLFTAACTLAGMVYVTARISSQLALVALAVVPVLIVLKYSLGRRPFHLWSEAKQFESSALSVVQEALAAARVVRAFGQEEREQARFVRHSSDGVWRRLQVVLLRSSFDFFVALIIALGTAAVLFIGVRQVRSGALSLGDVLVVMTYLSQLYTPLANITLQLTDLQSALAGAARAFSLLDELPDVAERPSARRVSRASGAVAFSGVTFAYGEGQPVLRNISLEVSPGTRLGIAGRTGAGKTTIVSLLTRFYDPTSGQILLDGVDLRDYRLADLRNQFALVLQESVLFSASVAENIAYGRPSASEREIVEAARAAHAHDFIVRLPAGYDTRVGERGMSLSGGERQRIALARAFLKDAPILILDEPTSSVDLKTEALVMEAIQRLMRGRTSFLISHRPSTLKDCDVVLVLDQGCLAPASSAIAQPPLGEKALEIPRAPAGPP